MAVRAKQRFSSRQRRARMARFISMMGLKGGERIIDLGGADVFWRDCPLPMDVTIVNLPGIAPPSLTETHHRITYVEGDACDLDFAADHAYDIAFSNSVIEHVGPPDKQEAFAREARRVAPRHWVQTPSIWFPIEAHNHMPFWWAYPESMKRHFIERWRRKLPAYTEMIEGTTVILRRDLQRMFPDAALWTERFMGIPKSYVVYR
jgi:hypothetical protein